MAWGIAPNEVINASRETVASLKDRLEEAMAPFTREGVNFKDLLTHSLLTPSCSLANIGSEEAAEMTLELLGGLSRYLRQRYL